MTTIETWTCPQHGVVAKGIRNPSMVRVISSHRINDHCYALLSIHSEDVDPNTLIRKDTYRQSEETQNDN